MSGRDIGTILANLKPGDESLTRFLRAAAARAFWFTALLAATIALIVVVGVAQGAGIRPWESGWESTAVIAGFLLFASALMLSMVMWSIRHVQMHRAMRELLQSGSTSGEPT